MRFIENGPSIPDDLLLARDEGRVVFFCGAGVSRAKAGLADFYELAESVLNQLRVDSDHVTRKVLAEAGEIHKRTGASGLISADRIFGILERDEFYIEDIEAAVAKTLQPKPNVDLSAHRIILALATTTEDKLRLVTTNFDRLFEAASKDQPKILQPSHLHVTVNFSDLNGIIHLHGIVDEHYQKAESDGFILTSSQFGRAYLADGWATRFFREILDQYVVVFIGYTADDPPVQYLLEALNKRQGQLNEVYAFQEGTENEAIGKWLHKGVQAIAFKPENNYCALWDTLEAWAERARSPESWYDSIIKLAKHNPKALRPFERGQVAHVVSNAIGARRFAEAEQLPPAEWLCVFDPTRRYESPGTDLSPEHLFSSFFSNANQDSAELPSAETEQKATINPFILYGLDCDAPPMPVITHHDSFKRDIPDTAWNAFAPTKQDRQTIQTDFIPAFRGHWAVNPIPQCPRLRTLGVWLSYVADQPAAIWWAAQQSALHPQIQQQIQWEMTHRSKAINPVIRQAWRYLFEFWSHQADGDQNFQDWHDFKMAIDQDGWTHQSLREYIALQRPFIKVKPNFWHKCSPPEHNENLNLTRVLNLEVEYPHQVDEIEISDAWLAICISGIRKNLEYGQLLDEEIGGFDRFSIDSILDNRPNTYPYSLYSRVIFFSQLFDRLVKLDTSSAQQELAAWPINDQSLFDRLRIYAAGKPELVSEQNFADILLGLRDEIFWDSHSQSDLLLVLSSRWHELSAESRTKLEGRILAGRQHYEQEIEQDFHQRNAWGILNRLHWLADHGCQLTFDLASVTQRLQQDVPNWKHKHSKKAAESMGAVTGGYVSSNEDCSALFNEKLATVLSKSQELSGQSDDFLVENAPYDGLCKEKPVRAFSALTQAAKNGNFPEWAWQSFLYSSQREQDPPKFSVLIAERIARCPAEKLVAIMAPVCRWLKKIGKSLTIGFYPSYLKVVDKLIMTLEFQPLVGDLSIIHDNKPVDWVFEAINSPVGDLVEILLFDPEVNGLQEGASLPNRWLSQIGRLLSLPTDVRRYALVSLASRLEWFYYWDLSWTETNMLAVLSSTDSQDQQAFASGFLRSNKVPNQSLYMRLKLNLLNFAKDGNLPKNRREQLIAILLAGWGSTHEQNGERLISDEELHDLILHWDDDDRSRLILLIRQWSKDDEIWNKQLPQLLQNVWPRQKSARTPRVSAALFELAFSSVEKFEQVARLILPLLTPIKRPYLHIPSIENILDTCPERALAIYYKVFSENSPTDLPYRLEQAIDRIGDVDKKLRTDSRWLQLKRKLDNR